MDGVPLQLYVHTAATILQLQMAGFFSVLAAHSLAIGNGLDPYVP